MIDRRTVYLVDDDASMRRALSRLITASGLEIRTFASAQEFLGSTLDDGPNCLLLDIRLPGVSGLELQASLASTHATVPIIFLTGHGTVPDCALAMRGGAIDFFEKPVDGERLLSAVERALEISRESLAVDDERQAIRHRLDTLTRREREVLSLVVTGVLNKQIAYELGAAEKTIKVHRARVMDKMAANSVADLVRMLHKLGVDTAHR
ncbi:MAG: response regulator transcription factor [Alphaproteobacteria bacterium]